MVGLKYFVWKKKRVLKFNVKRYRHLQMSPSYENTASENEGHSL
jgi:hypothetical protein